MMDRQYINRMMQMCMKIGDKASSNDENDRNAVTQVCGCGVRAADSVMRHGIADIQLLLNEFSDLKFKLEIAAITQNEINKMVESLLGQSDPQEFLGEQEMKNLAELCKPARDYIAQCIRRHDEEWEER